MANLIKISHGQVERRLITLDLAACGFWWLQPELFSPKLTPGGGGWVAAGGYAEDTAAGEKPEMVRTDYVLKIRTYYKGGRLMF